MKTKKQLLAVLMTVITILLSTACSGEGGIPAESGGKASPQTTETTAIGQLGSLQRTDETTLVQLGRTYTHSFPAGFYQEYALNDMGDQPLTITLAPAGDYNVALSITRSDDPQVQVLSMDKLPPGDAAQASFTPEAGVNYRVRVYEVSGNEAAYDLTIAPK